MMSTRRISRMSMSQPTIEGAGVHLHRAFGFREVHAFDPFLLLDDFRSNQPEFFQLGFPWHPHRGIETITYMLEGEVEHGDSMGNSGVITPGGVQWMTAGSGIIHQEMPKGDARGRMGGFQLWANLPADNKMMDPRYREILEKDIPVVQSEGATVRIICGEVDGTRGPVRDIVTEPEYLDVTLTPGSTWAHPTTPGYTVIAYVVDGRALFDPEQSAPAVNRTLVVLGDGDRVSITTQGEGARLLLLSGRPLHEPIAWYGPIVMNTQAELQKAFEEYQNGTFIKHG